MTYQISELMKKAPVIPVLQVEDAEHAVPMAKALVAGGLPVLEVTLRTGAALTAVEAMARSVPDAVVGVGTVTRAGQFDEALAAGAQFVVSPGTSDALLDAAERTGLPFLPGVVSPSEILMALEAGLDHLKFFPAEAYGGVTTLKAFQGPFPNVRFCPTGGVKPENYLDYLALKNVLCVGGTWLTPESALRQGDWARITEMAARVSGIRAAAGDGGGDTADDGLSNVGEEDPGSAAEDLVRSR